MKNVVGELPTMLLQKNAYNVTASQELLAGVPPLGLLPNEFVSLT